VVVGLLAILLIDLPAGNYKNKKKYCIVVDQAIPDATTIKAPVVTVYVEPADQNKIQLLSQKAEPDGSRGTVCTFVATMKNSTTATPTGPVVDEAITPLDGAKVSYEKHPTLPDTWIGTISGVQGDKSFKLISTDLKKVFFLNDAPALVKLPTDNMDSPDKNFVFAMPNGDVELESIQVQDGYTLSATALKVNSPLGTTSSATIGTIKFTGASNGTGGA